MAWTTPKTNWKTGELVTAEQMNAIGENLAELDRLRSNVAAYTTQADINVPADWKTFRDVDSDNLNLTITTSGGDVLIHFHGSMTAGNATFDVEVDGSRQGHEDGIAYTQSSQTASISFTRLIQDLNAGAHTFKLQTKRGATLKKGAQFWVREI